MMEGSVKTFVFALCVMLAAACVPHGKVNWPGLIDCAPETSDLVGLVSRILIADGPADQASISERGKQAMEDAARKYGPNTVACVVRRVVSDWQAPGAAQEPVRMAAAARGDNFLESVGAHPQLADPPAMSEW